MKNEKVRLKLQLNLMYFITIPDMPGSGFLPPKLSLMSFHHLENDKENKIFIQNSFIFLSLDNFCNLIFVANLYYIRLTSQ